MQEDYASEFVIEEIAKTADRISRLSSEDGESLSLGILNQMSEDDSFGQSKIRDMHKKLQSAFQNAGYSATIVNRNQLTRNFFHEDIYDFDLILLMTHGLYSDTKRHWFLTGEYYKPDIEWLITSLTKLGVSRQKEHRDGKDVSVDYFMVSEDYLAASDGRFDNSAIIFNLACHSLEGNNNVANVFLDKGAGVYLGYDDSNCRGYYAGVNFMANLLKGESVSEAYESLPYGERFDNYDDVWHEENNTEGKDITKHNAKLKLVGDGSIRITHAEESIRAYLERLYRDTDGDNWENNTNWCTDAPVEEWYGVYCWDSLYSISLASNNLRGSISLTNCPYIKYLDVSGNILESLNLGGCTNLTELHLWSYGDSTVINSIDVSGCKKLLSLDCGYGDCLMGLKMVRAVSCDTLNYFSHTEGMLSELDFDGCANLESVHCSDNMLEEITLAGCSALRTLYCNNNKLKELNLSDCEELSSLNCCNNQIISEIPEYFTRYKNLYYFTFDWRYEYAVFYQQPNEEGWIQTYADDVFYHRINDYGWFFPGEPYSHEHWWPE